MLINEVCKRCSLTKKAVEYYEEQGLISPSVMENGYRNFSEENVSRLKKIAVLRGLGLSAAEIRSVLAGKNTPELQSISDRKSIELDSLKVKQELIQYLAESGDWEKTQARLEQLDRKQTILTRLLERFPGYYGRYLAFHFSGFLNEPVETAEQQRAFEQVVDFLDRVEICIPEDLREYLDEATANVNLAVMKAASDSLAEAMENPEQYLAKNREIIERYMAFKQSPEYREAPASRLHELLRALNSQNGYNDVFIPAMERLSNSYRAYRVALRKADEAFLKAYPQAEKP